MADFLYTDKYENSIKKILIDDQLQGKFIFKNGVWVPICINDDCKELIKERHLCRKHLKEQNQIMEGTVIKRGNNEYIKTGDKWVIVCKICKRPSVKKTGYCVEHENYTGSSRTVGTIEDIIRNFARG
jgi:hypothetical protein